MTAGSVLYFYQSGLTCYILEVSTDKNINHCLVYNWRLVALNKYKWNLIKAEHASWFWNIWSQFNFQYGCCCYHMKPSHNLPISFRVTFLTYRVNILPIFFRVTTLALGQLYDCHRSILSIPFRVTYLSGLIFHPYPSGLLHGHWGNHMIAPVPVKQPWRIWVNLTTTQHNDVGTVCIFHGIYCMINELLGSVSQHICVHHNTTMCYSRMLLLTGPSLWDNFPEKLTNKWSLACKGWFY